MIADIGAAGGDVVQVAGVLSVGLDELSAAHEGWLPDYMAGKA